MSQLQDMIPSVAPENELEVPDDPSFVATCMAWIADDAERLGWRFGNSTLTQSDKWGLVWRVDFRTKNQSEQSASVKRVLCWRRPGEDDVGIAFIGKMVEPLK
jgi:hypothetical protein